MKIPAGRTPEETCEQLVTVRRGVFRSVAQLIVAIEEHIRVHNADAKPFIWTAKATDILAKVTRAKAKLSGIQSA